MVSVRAIYEQGHLRLLDPVDLQEGQEVHLKIAPPEEIPLRELIADMLVPAKAGTGEVLEDDAIFEEFDRVLAGLRPLSEIIIEDRGE